LKQLLDPLFDFSVKSATEVYMETLPPKVKQAIKNHEVLVGMNRDMVVLAKDRPPQKLREKDEQGKEYEEWIYGAAPKDVTFVRLVGDEVTQVKIMKVGGERVVKTEKEVEVTEGVVSLAAATARSASAASGQEPEPEQPANRPTLKRPGEQPEPAVVPANGGQQPQHHDEPQWGTPSAPPSNVPPPQDRPTAPTTPPK